MKKIHRFITEYKKTGEYIDITDTEIIHQIKSVLKLRSGENICVSWIDQLEITGEITNILKDKITIKIISSEINNVEPEKNVTLYLGILKKENFELVLQKAGEMGIAKIVPVITERTVKTNLNFERLNKIAREASELSGRSHVTEIAPITDFEDAVLNDTNKEKILFDITGTKFIKSQTEKVSIYIGPEGGFTEKEISFGKENSIIVHNLGSLTLRGETAGIIASYLALQ